jgi:hypothetical protein
MHNFMRVGGHLGAVDPWLDPNEYDADRYYTESPSPLRVFLSGLYVACGLAIWGIAIFAVAISNRTEVISACGDGLWSSVLMLVLLHGVVYLVYVFCSPWKAQRFDAEVAKYPWAQRICNVLGVCLVLGVIAVLFSACVLSAKARANPECVAALKDHSGAFGSDLLAIMGFVYFGWIVGGVVLLALYVVLYWYCCRVS